MADKFIKMKNNPSITHYAAVVGSKEKEGPLGFCFENYSEDSLFGAKSYEKAESRLQQMAINSVLQKANLDFEDIDVVFAGDLLNQCISSSFGLRNKKVAFVGLYGACSTMALSLCQAAIYVDNGIANKAIACTSSHFCSAERQYRFPLEYGSQRTPTAQWTVTGSGAVLVTNQKSNVQIESLLFGRVIDLGIKDANNMGAAMAPDDVKIRPYP